MKTLPEILKTQTTVDKYGTPLTNRLSVWAVEAAAEAIAKELMGCLPEKLELDYMEDLENHPLYTTYNINIEDCIKGYNTALDEVRARLTAFIGKEK